MRSVGKPIRKKDAMSLVTGKPVYVQDIALGNCLVVKVLRSPHANAIIEEINIEKAAQAPGIEAVFTYKDVPDNRFTCAGQTYPEPSPYDRLILDKHVRFVGDAVAVVAGETEKDVDNALGLIKVKYKELPAILDFTKSKDSNILVHPEENWRSLCDVGADNKRNLCASGSEGEGDIEQALKSCDIVLEETYHTLANQQAMMETFRTACYIDEYGRLNVLSSTQIVFHVRRILSNALGIPKSKIHVYKPRIGGGFGAKQTVVSELYPAFVTLKTGKPSMMIFSRKESQIASSPRHEMQVKVRLGANKDGKIKAIDVYTLSNTGAYGEHGPTTVGLSGHKSIPLYSGLDAFRFSYDVVYSNVMSAGAYRGYGATQGIFAVETTVNKLCEKLGLDPVEVRKMNMVKQGDVMPAYYGERTDSCALDRCLERTAQMIGWKEKYPCRDLGNGKIRSVGIAMAMQGSGISGVDVGSASISLTDGGTYRMSVGAADMGTGCDTILAQMAADCLECDAEKIEVSGADTDTSPYDSGSYASSTTYVTGTAVIKACNKRVDKMLDFVAQKLECKKEELDFDGNEIKKISGTERITLQELANVAMCGANCSLSATESNSSPVSPPPFMVGAVEIELDKETGKVEIIDYAATVDCGTVINPNLARVQAEGGIVQGIGMTLFENVQYDKDGHMLNDSFMQYKIPTRQDIGNVRVEFESSNEPTGPFGAKSIGEIVINTPAPAIVHAIANACGKWFDTLPVTSEKVAMAMPEKGEEK